jgi:hypothetical protein
VLIIIACSLDATYIYVNVYMIFSLVLHLFVFQLNPPDGMLQNSIQISLNLYPDILSHMLKLHILVYFLILYLASAEKHKLAFQYVILLCHRIQKKNETIL